MSYNPYAPPQASDAHGPIATYGGGPQPWEVGEVIREAWEAVKASWVTLVFSILVGRLIGAIPSGILRVLVATGVLIENEGPYWVALGVFTLIGWVIDGFFLAGFVKIWLACARGQEPQFGDLFNGGSRALPMILAFTLVATISLVGFALLLIPGIVASLGLCLYEFYVVDQEMGAVESMRASWEATKGHRVKIFLFGLVGVGIVLLGFLACGIGVLVSVAVLSVGMAIIYLRISGRGVAVDPRAPFTPAPAPGYGAGWRPPT